MSTLATISAHFYTYVTICALYKTMFAYLAIFEIMHAHSRIFSAGWYSRIAGVVWGPEHGPGIDVVELTSAAWAVLTITLSSGIVERDGHMELSLHGQVQKLQHVNTRDQTQGDQAEGAQDQQSIFSWHVHPAEQHGHGGRTTPVFPPRQKRSVKCAHRGQKRVLTHMQSVHFCVILFSKGVLMEHLCTKGIKMTLKCS